ncbi:amino acid adenylation domain-containing protein [Chloroflexi bacterium TSY]|nr:amino acid adenylation domain-containing protein [Chloroflexi bacterium TSY]
MVEAIFARERQRPFDFEQGPLLHASVGMLSSGKRLLVLTLPALCADRWTAHNLIQELSHAYVGYVGGNLYTNGLVEESLQYIQFSEWQHELLEDEEEAEEGKNFWQQQRFEEFPRLTLPFERESAAAAHFEPDVFTLSLDDEIVGRLFNPEFLLASSVTTSEEIDEGARMTAILLACWQTLLWRLTGESDILTGVVSDGRPHEMLHDAMGLFTKWVPVSFHFEPDFRLHEVIAQVEAAWQAAYEHQDYFLWESATIPAQTGATTPFFPIGFAYAEQPTSQRSGEFALTPVHWRTISERYHLQLSCIRVDHALKLEFHYDANRFQPSDVERLAGQFETLLRSAVTAVDAPVGKLEILDAQARQQLLETFNDTAVDVPRDVCLHQLFEEQAANWSERPAVVFGEQQLTYGELNARSNQLAHHLQSLGIGPDSAVGLCMERSVEMLVAVLGILKAGGAYVPLDPVYPAERLAFTLADAQATILLTQENVLRRLSAADNQAMFDDVQAICLDSAWSTIAQESDQNPTSEAKPEHLAYIIYTSGSSGQPKGVMIQHDSVVNLANALRTSVYADESVAHDEDPQTSLRVSVNAPLTFDSSVKQLIQFAFGHTLYIVPEEVRPDGEAMLAFVAEHKLDVLDCTPAQLRLILNSYSAQSQPIAPKLILIGGEAIDSDTWSALSKITDTAFYNVYGPTECTVNAAVCRIDGSLTEPAIGRPIANVQIFILDERLQPVPVGVNGELYIGGMGVARSYLNRPDLTTEKFIANPFPIGSSKRLYRTGDLARFLPDGNIQFLGRADHQVKLRGFRIELGEIEAVLCQLADVHECVVIVRGDGDDARLVAYVVPSAGAVSESDEWRTHLRSKLPEYMVPTHFVSLPRLPLTRNGKVDRKALPAPESVRQRSQAAYVAPRSEIEQTIADIWQEVLSVERVGINDNFFDLGGHSLLMVRDHTKLREAFEKEISLIDMFRNPTVTMLATYFSEMADEAPSFEKAQERASRRQEAQQKRRARATKRRRSQ